MIHSVEPTQKAGLVLTGRPVTATVSAEALGRPLQLQTAVDEMVKRGDYQLKIQGKVGVRVNHWADLKAKVLQASVGIAADLKDVLDKVDPTIRGTQWALGFRQTYDTLGFQHDRVILRPENLAIGSIKDDPNYTSLVGAYTDVQTHETLGYIIRWYDVPNRICHRKYVMFQVGDPRTKGVGLKAAAGWENLVPILGIDKTTIECAYVGRLVWALEGFDFRDAATLELVRQKFSRFMERFDLNPEELYFRRDDGTTEPFSFDKLQHSWDFAHVMWKKGVIRLPTRTSDLKDDEGTLDAGRAFLLCDFRQPGLNDCACPHYFGQKPTDPESPGQRQAKAYAEARAKKSA